MLLKSVIKSDESTPLLKTKIDTCSFQNLFVQTDWLAVCNRRKTDAGFVSFFNPNQINCKPMALIVIINLLLVTSSIKSTSHLNNYKYLKPLGECDRDVIAISEFAKMEEV